MSTHTQLAPQPTIAFDHRVERIVFLGTPDVSVPTLEALAATALRPIAVITEPDKPVGRRHQLTPPAVKRASQQLGIPVAQPATAEELQAVVESLHPTLGVVVAYGRILKAELLAVPSHGFVNLHFSILPRFRGATPMQAAIVSGDAETGVTLMQIDAGLDTGPIFGFTAEPIRPTDTTATLGGRLAQLAGMLATELLPALLGGTLVAAPQAQTMEPVTRRLTKEDGRIDWQQSVLQLERFIRAMQPWPKAWTELTDQRVIVHAAHVIGDQLVLDQLQVAGSRVISGSEFSRGYPALVAELTGLKPTVRVVS